MKINTITIVTKEHAVTSDSGHRGDHITVENLMALLNLIENKQSSIRFMDTQDNVYSETIEIIEQDWASYIRIK